MEYIEQKEQTTIEAIKMNLDGIKKISKERILNELFKIIITKSFVKMNNNKQLKEIFTLIFAEFKYLERLNKLVIISNKSNFDKKTLLAIMLIDEKNNHEYFSHKYNVSNELKETLSLIAQNYLLIQKNKEFFQKDLKKNTYFFGKTHLMILNTLHFTSNKKMKIKNYLDVLNNIKKIDIPKFSFDGNYLKEKGMKEGALIGKTLKLIESEWLDNNFKVSDKRVLKIIKEQNR